MEKNMSEEELARNSSTPITVESLVDFVESIKKGDVPYNVAKTSLEKFLENKNLMPDAIIKAYTALTIISAETCEVENVSKYVEEVQKLEINSPEEKRAYADLLFSIAITWSYQKDNNQKAREYFQKSLKIAAELMDTRLVLKNRNALAELLREDGEYDEVLNQKEELLSLAQKTNDPHDVARVQLLIANVQRKTGNYEEAIKLLGKVRELLANDRNSGAYLYTLWALGTCYAAIEDEEKAKIFLDLACHPEGAVNSEIARINILSKMTLAELQTVVGKYDKAEMYYSQMAEAINGDESSYYGRRLIRGRALLAIKKGDFDKANELIDRLVVMAASENKHKEIMRLRLLKAEVLLRTGEAAQHEQANTMLQEALAYHRKVGSNRHIAVCLELLARLDSHMGYPSDSLKKADEMAKIANEAHFERLWVRAKLIEFTLMRKLGKTLTSENLHQLLPIINKLNTEAERVILARFESQEYDQWMRKLSLLDEHSQRYVNEFFEDFHFVPEQSIDMEIDPNSHYVREKHLGEIPFHNKFTLMKILLLVAQTPGREYSKEELALKIWNQEYNPLRHDNNIYININRLRKLVEPNPRESRYIMNGSRGYYFNPAMKVNFSTKISNTAPRIASTTKKLPEVF